MDSGEIDDEITRRIIECIIHIHRELGPGFIESVYQSELTVEFRNRGIDYEREKEIEVFYSGELVGRHRLDLVAERKVILELKTVEAWSKAHYAQVRSYLKATGVPVALLVNFAGEKADLRRVTLP